MEFKEIEDLNFEDSLFTDESELVDGVVKPIEEKDKEDKDKTIEIDENELFSSSESVDSEDKQDTEDTVKPKNDKSVSPNTYSILATALKNDGILPDLDDDFVATIKDADSLAAGIEKQVEARLESNQKRIKEALDNGVETNQIRQFENTITYLNSISEDDVNDETDKGIKLRSQLIFQDYINKGYSKDVAQKKLDKSISNGDDIEDALEALQGNKEHYSSQYNKIIEDAKADTVANKKALKKEAEDLEKLILNTESPFAGIKLDKTTRKLAYDNINKAVFKDEDGTYLTAIQQYQKEHRADFLHKLGVIFTLTNGFKDMNGLIKGAVIKEKKSNLKELEHLLTNSNNFLNGNLEFVGGEADKESYSGRMLDI